MILKNSCKKWSVLIKIKLECKIKLFLNGAIDATCFAIFEDEAKIYFLKT